MIVYVPSELQVGDNLDCAICNVQLSLDRATVGLFNANNRQAFSCVSHLSEVEKLINGWADFIAQQRMKYLQLGQEPTTLIYSEGQ